ncbi:hypothetical protein [Myroides sp. DF42-4-2]|uniref:hypothetical protein n=1 Tax=unclassified Myroides TaxID=2642485 RepID=UPI0025773F37|nr:hypothetical protein [Myroides sp. DF42-4-2]MDM1407064.1 hypothetical protein [Myroides sp. DF42-4-2]
MKKLFLSLLLTTSAVFSQSIKKTELTNKTLGQALFIKEAEGWGGPYKSQFEDNFVKNEKIYIFEMEYQGKVFFREALKKTTAKGSDSALFSNMYRFKTDFFVPYDIFDKDTKLDMLERRYTVYDVDGVRYLYYQEFEPIKRINGHYVINPDVPEYISLKVYELSFD